MQDEFVFNVGQNGVKTNVHITCLLNQAFFYEWLEEIPYWFSW